MQLAVIAAIVIAIAGVAFAMQNSVPATVVFLIWRFDGSLGVILLLALALGALIVALVSTPATLRANWVIGRQRKEIDGLKSANAELRAGRSAGFSAAASQAGASGREPEPKD